MSVAQSLIVNGKLVTADLDPRTLLVSSCATTSA